MSKQKTSHTLIEASMAFHRIETDFKNGGDVLPDQQPLNEHLKNVTDIALRAMKKLVSSGKSGDAVSTHSVPAYRALRQILDATQILAEEAGMVDKPKIAKRTKL